MASEQFSQTVSGGGGRPVQTNAQGTIETNDYPTGGSAELAAGDYPHSLNPAETIEELNVTQNEHADLRWEVHTTGGDVFYLQLKGSIGSFNRWKVDKLVVSDPQGTGASAAYNWGGE